MFTKPGMTITPFAEKRSVAHDCSGNDPHAALYVAVLERNLVGVLERPELLGLDVADPEVVEDRLLRVLIDDPLVSNLARNAAVAAIERGNDLLDSGGVGHAATLAGSRPARRGRVQGPTARAA